MLEHIKIQNLDDFFIDLDKRSSRGVFFYKINGYNEEIYRFIKKYYNAAKMAGVIIEGKIPNPDKDNLEYYNEIMGTKFQLSVEFIAASLKKWLPRMSAYQNNVVSSAIYETLTVLGRNGKNENMLKNTYIKFMCWLYYKFERILSQLGNNKIPKILYEGIASNYELLLLNVLSGAGCDIVLLQYQTGSNTSVNINTVLPDELTRPDMGNFPEYFSLKWLRDKIQNEIDIERLYGQKPSVLNCTNAWIDGKGLDDFKIATQARGNDPMLFYNCYIRINGAQDKLSYMNELYQFQLGLKNSKRRVVIIDAPLKNPSTDEISQIKRQNYTTKNQMIMDLSGNIKYTANAELQKIMVKSFVDVIIEESGHEGITLNRLANRAVYLLCWLKRYQGELFANWKMPDISCFIYMGGCKNSNEALFIKFLARLPVDVLILNPNLNTKCCLDDTLLYEINYTDTLTVDKYPRENTEIHMGTAAYHAERELDTVMYQDFGIYRNKQYSKAVSVTLRTMYEEIEILWNQELKYRPNFSIVDDIVNLPVICAKVCGVKNSDLRQYWAGIKQLLSKDAFLIDKVPYLITGEPNPIKSYATEFFKNGKVQKNRIKAHKLYQYGVLRNDVQEHILDKLQLLIDQKVIKGTFVNGTEYTVVSTVLNIKKEILRMIQKFDFTKTNPKIIYINTTEKEISLEDSILMAFLNLVGFDVLFFVPTGYQTIEKYFNKEIAEEHQIGDYMYDLRVPDFNSVRQTTRLSWHERLFGR